MKIRFLGTGAADWKLSKTEQEIIADGTFYRRSTCNLIDEHILIDLSPQSYDYAVRLGVDMSKITDLIISHTHADHYSAKSFVSFAKASGRVIDIWCEKDAVCRLGLDEETKEYARVHPLCHEDTFEIHGYKITALSANHLVENSNETPLHYVFEKDGKRFFYGLDGGWFTARTWEYMRLKKLCFDGMVLDSTVGDKDGDFRLGTHNSIPMLRLIVASLRENGMIHADTKLIASHLARTLHLTELCDVKKQFAEIGMTVVCDGDELDI